MKIIKWIIGIIILGGLIWWGTDAISPRLSINSFNPQHVYGDTIAFRINVVNFSPQPKQIYIENGDNLGISLLVDGADPTAAIPKEKASATITLGAFHNKTIEHVVTLTRDSGEVKPQKLSPSDDVLNVTPGQHSVKASWGGHTSDAYTFGVR